MERGVQTCNYCLWVFVYESRASGEEGTLNTLHSTQREKRQLSAVCSLLHVGDDIHWGHGPFDVQNISRQGYSAATGHMTQIQTSVWNLWGLGSLPAALNEWIWKSPWKQNTYQTAKRWTQMEWEELTINVSTRHYGIALCNSQRTDYSVKWHGWPEGGAVQTSSFIWLQHLMCKFEQTLVKPRGRNRDAKTDSN